MVRYFCLVFYVFFSVPFCSFANENRKERDSLLRVVEHSASDYEKASAIIILSEHYLHTDLDTFLLLNTEALGLINKIRVFSGDLDYQKTNELMVLEKKAKVYNNLGLYHYYRSNINKALEYHTMALEIARKIQSEGLINQTEIHLSLINIEKGSLLDAYRNLSKLLYENRMSDKNKAMVLSRIAYIFFLIENYEFAIEYAQKLLILGEEQSDSTMIVKAWSNLGAYHTETRNYDSAHYYLSLALKYGIEKNIVNTIISTRINLATLYEITGENEKGVKLRRENLLLIKQEGLRKVWASELFGLIKHSVNENEIEQAENYMTEFDSLLISLDDVGEQLLYYRAKKMVAESKQAWDEIYETQKKIDELKALLDDKNTDRELASIELERKKKQEQKKLELQHRIEKNQERNKRTAWVYGYISFTIVLLLTGFIYLRKRRKRVNREKHELESEIELQNKELTSYSIRVNQSNEYLQNISDIAKKIEGTSPEIESALRELHLRIRSGKKRDKDWMTFQEHFNKLNPHFIKKITTDYSELTPQEVRLCSLLKLNIDSYEIAELLGITQKSLRNKKYRIHKKMNLPHGEKLAQFILRL